MTETISQTNTSTSGQASADAGIIEGNKGADSKTFSQEQVNEMISKRIAEMKLRNAEDSERRLNEAKIEWERQQKLTDEERASEETRRREEALNNKEREIALRENRADAKEALIAKNMAPDLVDFVATDDQKTTQQNIENLAKIWSKAVAAATEDKIKGSAGAPLDVSLRSRKSPRAKNVLTF